ncbi:poly-beta-1,6 N-acetyl-D-glucosamine export porin PgaA [Kangiella aquimarina]|uniref:Poly-beta-1,6 N-acetyl-D-glucosamine export porin PgaA n=1 Tax=Kangiella aquimarina TaxID=261965 RepID=A0ABZ0X1S7_9GAMM|nr:poly-beta-1,6 N-acetyl-D-glucosamine export porin PgaA [Kangiella aquimarina]WQG84542.1 poly-beta-1,6 N-acetyl-D-glucosamine export porin PgaA [Kangiella aquimarina]
MKTKLVLILAVYSFILYPVYGFQAQQRSQIAETPDATVKGNTAFDEFNNDLSINLVEQDYDLWASKTKSEYPDLTDRAAIYRRVLNQFPKHRKLQADYVTVLTWNSQFSDALSYYSNQLLNQQLPHYALNAVAISARETGNYALSKKLYLQILKDDSQYYDAILGLAAVAIRENNFVQAEAYIQKVLAVEPENEEGLSLLAFLYNQQNNKTLEKVSVYDKMLELAQDDQEITRLKTLNLLELGLIAPASRAMESSPELYLTEDWIKLRAAQNTKSIRRIANDGRSRENEELVNKAFDNNDEYLKLLQGSDSTTDKQLAYAYADRVLLLNALTRHKEVISLAQQQNHLVPQMPDHGVLSITESYLAEQEPDNALDVIDNGFNNNQIAASNKDALQLAYYAALDIGALVTAEEYLETLISQSPAWLYSADKQIKKPNPDYQTVALMQAMHKAYTNDLEGAEDALQKLLAVAPNNNEYRYNLANVLRWRGFVKRSNQQLTLIKATDPDYLPLEISRAYNFIAYRQFHEANQLIEQFPEKERNNSVKRLIEDYDIATDASFYASTSGGNSSGSQFSSNDRNFELAAYSQLLNHHWRMFSKAQNNQSSFFGDNENIMTIGIGGQYISKSFISELELFKVEELNSAELAGSIEYFHGDYLSFNAGYQSFNKETPVRAFYSGVSSDLKSFSTTYRHSDKQSYSASWNQSDFSDGNKRQTFSISGSQGLFQSFKQRFSLNEYLYLEENSEDTDRLYFNPESALGFSLTANYQHLLYKYSDLSLWHGISLEAGIYQQKNFSSGDIWSARYQHQWQLSKRSFLNYSIGYKQRIYDGQTESGPDYNLSYGVTF